MKLRWVGVLVALAAFAYGILWFELAAKLESALTESFEQLATQGVEVDAEDAQRRGFPHQIQVTVEGLRMRAQTAQPVLAARASGLRLTLYPWRPGRLLGEGEQVAFTRGEQILIAPQVGIVAARVDDGHEITLDLDAASLLDAKARRPFARVTGLRLTLALSADEDSADSDLLEPTRAQISLAARKLAPGSQARSARPAELRLEAVLHGRLALPWGQGALAQWRDAGGTLEIEELRLDWGEAALTAQGSLSLDRALRPLGAMTVSVTDPSELLDHLQGFGILDKTLAGRLRPLFDALPKSSGGEQAVNLPLSLQDGQIFLAGFPIARL